MKCIVGLGNPGKNYDKTRHNVGFDVIDRLANALAAGEPASTKFDAVVVETRCEDEKILLIKPQGYMNRSGLSIKQTITFFKAEPETDLLVIVDDIHLPCGSIRLRKDGSGGGHNGLENILNHLGNDNWSRLRIGVDEPGLIPQSDYVLGRFTPEQVELVEPALEAAVTATTTWIQHGIDEAMNKCNETGNSQTTRKEQ